MIYNDTVTLNGLKQDLYFMGKFNSGTFSQSDLNRIINKYYLQAQTVIRGVNEMFYAVPTKATLAAGSNQQYSWPTDYEKIVFIELALRPASLTAPTRAEYQRATIVTPDQITTPGFTFAGPTVISYGDYFEIMNNVTSQVTNGVRMVYIPKQSQMSADSDTPNIFEDYHDVITWGSLIDIAPRLNNTGLLQEASAMYVQRKADLANNASGRILSMAGSYVEGQISEGGWDFPWGGSPR